MKLIISKEIHSQLKEIVFACEVETGACLFGAYEDAEDARVLHIAGPGKNSTHLAFHYRADNEHYENVYNELLKDNPKLEHLGEFHVHPGQMSELSCGDRRTVKKVLKTYEKFIAGVILRTWGDYGRVEENIVGYRQTIKIFPVYFTRDTEVPCELVIE